MKMILEELQRNFLMQQQYKDKITQLPKGTVVSKQVGNHEYYYLKYRDGKRTITDYIGRDKHKIENAKRQVEKKRHFKKMLAGLREENRLIQKVIGKSV